MPRQTPPVNRGIDLQLALAATRQASAPLWEAAIASGDWALMAETKALAETLRVAAVQVRRVTGLHDRIACPDGRAGANHGKAA